MNHFTNIFLKIREKISEEIPEIKDVRIYNQQELVPNEKAAFNTPSLFVEFASIEYSSSNYDSQQANFEISIRVVDQGYTLNMLSYHELIDKVKWCLQGFIGLKNTESFSDSNFDNFISWELMFEMSLRECPQTLKTQEVCGVNYALDLRQAVVRHGHDIPEDGRIFRAVNDGDWSDVTLWEVYIEDHNVWLPAIRFPSKADDVAFINEQDINLDIDVSIESLNIIEDESI